MIDMIISLIFICCAATSRVSELSNLLEVNSAETATPT